MALTPTGLVIPTLQEIREEVNQKLRSRFGESLDLSDDSLLGQIVGIFAERERLLWEAAQAVNASQDPDQATGAALEAIAAITGTVRRPAEPSTVTLTLVGDPGTIVSAGSRAAVQVTEDEFETLAGVTLLGLPPWATSTLYSLGQLRHANGNVYVVTTAGTSAGAGSGPSTESLAITDGTVVWRFLGDGTAAVTVEAASVDDGPIIAMTYTLNEIVTPVSGWDAVINLEDAELGSLVETDEELADRREQELAQPGATTTDAIRADLQNIEGVESVTVFENDTDFTNGDGMPPHSIEALVLGGADQDIFDGVLRAKGAGIQTHGTESGFAVDSSGVTRAVKFSRAVEVDIWVIIELNKDPGTYPLAGDDAVETAVLEWADDLANGKNVVASAISAQAFKVPGVLDVENVFIGTAPAPALSTTIDIAVRERAAFDSVRISVISVDGTP